MASTAEGLLGHAYVFGLGTDFLILGILTAILLAMGSYFFSKIQL